MNRTPVAERQQTQQEARKLQIELRDVRKSFRRQKGAEVHAIDNVSLSVEPGEFVVLLGPSGCGKTTLLRAVVGLERPDSGRIAVEGRALFDSAGRVDVPPERRRVGMMFQAYALWPHLTVAQNVAYPLRAAKVPRREIPERVDHMLELVGVGDLGRQSVSTISGGQQQRVALARALVAGNSTVLFDEPLSNVDAKVREQLRDQLIEMQERLGFTALYVTHDQEEAMTLASRIVVLREGRIAQDGSPHAVYRRPVSAYVANFVGRANQFPVTVQERTATSAILSTPFGTLRAAVDESTPSSVGLAVTRPENWRLEPGIDASRPNAWRGVIERVRFVGSFVECTVRIGDVAISVAAPQPLDLSTGSPVSVSIEPACVLLLEG